MPFQTSENDPFQAHAGFLRRLAQQLVRDEHDREDVLQEAWFAAYAAETGADGPLVNVRAWLARVVRNRASNLQRDRGRREDFDREIARERVAEESSVEHELGVQEQVLAAVSDLREPYRTAIYMRYYRELSPPAIADELDVPLATIDSRLLRGREFLRERLTRQSGGRERWVLALLPLCPPNSFPVPSASATGVALSVGIVGMKLKLALFALVTVAAVSAWQWGREAIVAHPVVRGDAVTAAPELEAPATLENTAAPGVTQEAPGRTEVATKTAPSTESKEPAASAISGMTLSGIVLDPAGQPLASAHVRFLAHIADGGASTALTDVGGRFEFEGLPSAGRVRADEPGWTTVIEGALMEGAVGSETTVVVAPAHELEVTIIDEGGVSIVGALVQVRVPPFLRARMDRSFEGSIESEFIGTTAAEGVCALTVPVVEEVSLRVKKIGFETLVHDLDADDLRLSDTSQVTLALRPLSGMEQTLSGRVIDAFGDGVPNAIVEVGRLDARADGDGHFHLDLSRRKPFESWDGEALPQLITAAAPNLLPVVLEVWKDADGNPQWPDPLVLQLVDQPLAVEGRVVDQDGVPLKDAVVFLPRTHLIGGRTTIEAEMRGRDEELSFFLSERTGADGRFVFRGLLDERYAISAFQEDTLLRGDVEEIQAGSRNVEIKIDTRAFWPEVHGRVESHDGLPLPDVLVQPRMDTQNATGSTGNWNNSAELLPVRTDAHGRFVLAKIPRGHVTAGLSHPDLLYIHSQPFQTESSFEDAQGNLVDVVLTAPLRMRFQVQLDDPHEADSFRLLAADETELSCFSQTATNYNASSAYFLLHEGRSKHLFVNDRAVTLVLLREGEEVRRAALELTWLEETVLR